jgi:peptide/nickel transport system substrate-binding protein
VRTGRSASGWCFAAITLFLTVIGPPGCSKPASTDPGAAPVTLHIGLALPKTSDVTAGLRNFVSNLLSEQLIGIGWDGRPVGRLASDWTWEDNGLTLKIFLRENLKFHDGTPIDSAFVKKGLEELFRTPSVSYRSVTAVEAIDSHQLKIRLLRPEALLVADLSNFLLSHPTNRDIGAGPFRILERTPRVRLAAFDDYYRGRPQIDFVEVEDYDEQRASWAALMRGDIDAVHEITPGAIDFVDAEGQTNVRTFPFIRPYYIQLVFNVRHPVLKNPLVRQALSYAVDRQGIIDGGLNRQGTAAEGPLWPFHWAYSTAQKSYSHNTEAATLRLDAAGLRVKPVREPGRMPSRFRFRCLTVAKVERYEKIALRLQKQLYDIGVEMEIEPVPLQQLGERIGKGDFDAILAERTSGRSLSWTYMTFHSSMNPAGYKAADEVLDRLRLTRSDGEVRTAVSDLQQVFHDDPPAIFIAWPKVARVVSAKFEVPVESGRDVLSSIWQWKLAESPR